MSALRSRGRIRPTSVAALIVAALLVAIGCATPTPSPSPSPSPSAPPSPSPTASAPPSASPTPLSSAEIASIYDAIEAQVVEIRGLQPKRDVARRSIDEAELRTILTEMFDAETPPEYVAANERLYKALGLIDPDANLRKLSLDLLSGGVAGFYRAEQNTLYIVSATGAPGVNERITFAHEFDHALQDQNTSVFTDQDGILDQTDRILARQAIYEGDATLLMSLWALSSFDATDMAELIALGSDPAPQALLDGMPPILKETLLFPYTTGSAFVQAAQARGGWAAVDAFYDRLPESTEQILHPEAYAAKQTPIAVDLPDDLADQLGTGWTAPLEDTFGELQLGIWLRGAGLAPADATAAGAGWGGDRLAVVEGPNGAWGVVIETTWDTAADAAEFHTAARLAVSGLAATASVSARAGKGVTILIASDDETLLALDLIFGSTGV